MTAPTPDRIDRVLLGQAREFFQLEEFERRARSLDGDTKRGVVRDLARARELRRGADVLWEAGCPARAFQLAIEALTTLVGAIDARDDVEPSDREPIAAIQRDLAATPPPELDEQVAALHPALFRRLRETLLSLEGLVEPYGTTARGVDELRRRRRSRAGVVATLFALGLFLVIAAQFRTKAVASAVFSEKYDPMNVLDGNHESEWLLPNGTLGWIDVSFAPSRTVHRVRLVNAHNKEFSDRATRDFRIEVYAGNTLLKSQDASFPEFTQTPGWMVFELGGEYRRVTRVRLVIKSFFQSGAGFGEIAVD